MKKLACAVALFSALSFAAKCPVITSISHSPVSFNDRVQIYGENFGNDPKAVDIALSHYKKALDIVEVTDNTITLKFPYIFWYNEVNVIVTKNGCKATFPVKIKTPKHAAFMDFDPSDPWTSDNAKFTYENKMNGFGDPNSIKVESSGYMVFKSPAFSTLELGPIGKEMKIHLYTPKDRLYPAWMGSLEVYVDIPAAGIRNARAITRSFDNSADWVSTGMEMPDEIYQALLGDYPNAHFMIVLNIPETAQKYQISQISFWGDMENHRTAREIAPIIDLEAASFMSFDNIDDWSANNGELFFVADNKTEGLGATGIQSSSYTVVNSRQFQASELGNISDKLNFNLFVPSAAPNDFWNGNVSLNLTCAEDGILNETLGEVDLNALYTDEYNKVEFSLESKMVSKLKQATGSCQFTIHLNTYNGSAMFLLDNMGFVKPVDETKPKVTLEFINHNNISFNVQGDAATVDFTLSTTNGVVVHKISGIQANSGINDLFWDANSIPDGRYIATITYKGKAYGSYVLLK